MSGWVHACLAAACVAIGARAVTAMTPPYSTRPKCRDRPMGKRGSLTLSVLHAWREPGQARGFLILNRGMKEAAGAFPGRNELWGGRLLWLREQQSLVRQEHLLQLAKQTERIQRESQSTRAHRARLWGLCPCGATKSRQERKLRANLAEAIWMPARPGQPS